MLKRSDVLALLRVAEAPARSRAEYDHNVSSGRQTTGKGPRFNVAEWRAQYRAQWPKAYAGWLWTGAGALSLDIVPSSIEPASLDAKGYEDGMNRMLEDARTMFDALLRVVITDAQPQGWDGPPVVGLQPSHGRPIVWIDARMRPMLTKLEWYSSTNFTFVAGFAPNYNFGERPALQAILMPVRV